MRAMYAGISGMKANQTKLDVIGNNIANVGTTAFKGSRARFEDSLSQAEKSATAPSTSLGGTNAEDVGLGVQLAGIDRIMGQGNMQPTGRALDCAIDGNGFFMVSKGPKVFGDNTLLVNQSAGSHNIISQSAGASDMYYTRDGAFTLDENGNLLTSNGYRVMGYALTNGDNTEQPTAKSPQASDRPDATKNNKNNILKTRRRTRLKKGSTTGTTGTTGAKDNSLHLAGLDFNFGPGSQLNGYGISFGATGPGTIPTAYIDKAKKSIVISGNIFTPDTVTSQQVQISINKALSSAGIVQNAYVSGVVDIGKIKGKNQITKTDIISTPLKLDDTGKAMTPLPAFNGLTFTVKSGVESLEGYKIELGDLNSSKFSVALNQQSKIIILNGINQKPNGNLVQTEVNNALNAAGINGSFEITGNADGLADPESEQILDGGTSVESLNQQGVAQLVNGADKMYSFDGDLKTLRIPQKVQIPGTDTFLRVKTFSIDKQGVITAQLEGGKVAALGQIAMVSFSNPEGLTDIGKNLYSASVNSGTATLRTGIGTTGADNSEGFGSIMQGALEMSNVDLAQQFTDMIVTTRAFQANGKMITTGDEILQDVINLKR